MSATIYDYYWVSFFRCTNEGAERFYTCKHQDWEDVSDLVDEFGYDVEDVREYKNECGETCINVYLDCGD